MVLVVLRAQAFGLLTVRAGATHEVPDGAVVPSVDALNDRRDLSAAALPREASTLG